MSFTLGQFFPSNDPVNEPHLELDSPHWKKLEGGYRKVIYDASIALKKLEKANNIKQVNEIYQELWDELHHQGDVGIASYYAVPHLVRIAKEKDLVDHNVLSLVSIIEIQRHKDNPGLPKALYPAYNKAIVDLADLATSVLSQDWGLGLASSALAAIALAKGQIKLANAISNMDSEDVIDEFLEMY